ncbi:MAG: hypothetical protein EAZ53_15785 [Bacteroidetes bacterium]|nr:MAG: hypothetical protein EAZ53_15785 [Bacteroidota bacterium]
MTSSLGSNSGDQITPCRTQPLDVYDPIYGDTTTYAYKEDIIKICKCNPLRLLNNDSIFYKGKITDSTDKSYFTIKVKNLKYNLLIDKNTKKVLVNSYIYRYVDTVGYKIMKNISFDNFAYIKIHKLK